MNRILCLTAALLCSLAPRAQADPPFKPFITGLKNPESAAVGPDGRVYVSYIGEFNKDSDGGVVVIKDGKAVPFAGGMDDPKGMVAFQKWLFVADNTRIWKVDMKGKAEVYVQAKDFPTPPVFLNDLTVDPEAGTLFVSDSGDRQGKEGAVYRITSKQTLGDKDKKARSTAELDKVDVVVDFKTHPQLHTPNGLAMDGQSFLLLADFGSGKLYRIKLADKTMEQIADGMDGADGVTWDHYGRLYVSSWKTGKIFVIPRPGDRPILLAEGFESAADICLDPTGKFLLVPDMKAGTLTKVPAVVPGAKVDMTPLKLETAVAFPDLKWTGWKGETDAGKVYPLRPLLLTHAGDTRNRVFVGIQQGVVHVFPNDPKADQTKIFLDIQKRVYYTDNENEQGFLGLAFHPKYKENGEFFVFYTTKIAGKPTFKGNAISTKYNNVLSRFKVSKDDPNKADPDSEEELLRIDRPFWNHAGGTICFGPDGYLYLALGDGGKADDPFNNGQNLKSMLGKIHRIDVDHKDAGKNYAIPKDNPFTDAKIDSQLYQRELKLAQLKFKNAQLQLKVDQLQLKVDLFQLEVYQTKFKNDREARQRYEELKTFFEERLDQYRANEKKSAAAVAQGKANIATAEANVKTAEANFAVAESDLAYAQVKEYRPETWAWGLRNVWRMAFDRKTGQLWAADVGQNLYEEINLITKGGNYGWRRREGLHPFGPTGTGPIPELIDPIWEYHHDVGRSITGGFVYRGTKLPELDGYYLHADYVTGKIWALRDDEAKKRVVANRPIADRNLPIMSFGEDERGEAYLMTYSNTGRGIYQIVRTKKE